MIGERGRMLRKKQQVASVAVKRYMKRERTKNNKKPSVGRGNG